MGFDFPFVRFHNLFKPLGILAPTDYYIIWLSNIVTSSVPDVVRNKLDIYVRLILKSYLPVVHGTPLSTF
jgi:hypothetical protein